MTAEDIDHLKRTIKNGMRANSLDPTWKKAFDEFNAKTSSRYYMGCAACYGKVIVWHSKNITE